MVSIRSSFHYLLVELREVVRVTVLGPNLAVRFDNAAHPVQQLQPICAGFVFEGEKAEADLCVPHAL